jgi:hypothetical protein
MGFMATLLGIGRLPGAEPLPDGGELARGIRELAPEKSVEISATMEVIERVRKRHKIPVVIRIEKTGQARWSFTCLAKRDGKANEQWRVHHELGQANRYEHNSRPVDGAKIHTDLAGSSFTIADLGLEFLHWPSQVVLKTQRRKSRLCDVLESRNPKPAKGEYQRVLSWIDKKTGGILLADIYTDEAKPVKQFSVRGISKKEGRWQVDEMEMRDTKTRVRSRLHFHLK